MNASNELAVHLVLECLEENLVEPNRSYPTDIFEERSYARWAATEIAEMLMDRPHEFPDLIIEEFIFKMVVMEYATDDPKKSRIFSVAKETAKDILTLF